MDRRCRNEVSSALDRPGFKPDIVFSFRRVSIPCIGLHGVGRDGKEGNRDGADALETARNEPRVVGGQVGHLQLLTISTFIHILDICTIFCFFPPLFAFKVTAFRVHSVAGDLTGLTPGIMLAIVMK